MEKTSRRAFVGALGAITLGVVATATCSYLKYRALQRASRSPYEILKEGTDEEFEIALQKTENELLSRQSRHDEKDHIKAMSKHPNYNAFRDDEHFVSYLQGPSPFIKTSLKNGYFLDAYVEARRIGLDEKRLQILLKHSYLQHKLSKREEPRRIPIEELTVPEPDKDVYLSLEYLMTGEWMGRVYGHLMQLRSLSDEEVFDGLGYKKAEIKSLANERYQEYLQSNPNPSYPSEKWLRSNIERSLSF